MTYEPEKSKIEEVTFSNNKLLMKRYSLINKASEADVVGIIVTNPSLVTMDNQLEGLKNLLAIKEKKYFVFTMNKLNEPKIKNFPEIDIFVVISCPKSSFYDYSEFYKVVVVPHEMRIALEDAQWDTNIYLDSKFTQKELENKPV